MLIVAFGASDFLASSAFGAASDFASAFGVAGVTAAGAGAAGAGVTTAAGAGSGAFSPKSLALPVL